jgi:phytoene synthase
MTALDPDRILALSYVPGNRRAAISALWRLDAALGAVLARGTEPALSQIKLVWWRDSLGRLDSAPAPAEPTLEAVARHILPEGIRGSELAALEQGWSVLLGIDALTGEELQAYASARGAALFGLTARLLGTPATENQLRAGEAWALTDLARHSGNPDAQAALTAARDRLYPSRWPSALRPLGMLAVLAERDAATDAGAFEPQGSPGRMLRLLRHRLTGR